MSNESDRSVVLVDGVRTAFVKAGTTLKDVDAAQLAGHVFRSVIDRANLDPALIDEVILGCVGQPSNAQNVARAAALLSGVPSHVPAMTVHRNCASGFEAVTCAAERIAAGRGDLYLVGGAESMSNYPLLFPKSFGEWFAGLPKLRTPAKKPKALEKYRLIIKHALEMLGHLSKFKTAMLKPEIGVVLGLTDYACGLIMGVTAENLAVEFGISREAQDEFALGSHQKAAAAADRRAGEISPIPSPDFSSFVTEDNGIRANQSMADLARLKPHFDRAAGTVTVGNSSQLTDGAGALIVTTESRARELGLIPRARLRGYDYAGLAPERMGLGPVFATAKAFRRTGLSLNDIDLIELNEAFASQVIACERAFASDDFARKELGLDAALGEINREILNVNGGAIALGHPVGATGARLLITLIEELHRRGKSLGLATLCIGGGQGGALIVESV